MGPLRFPGRHVGNHGNHDFNHHANGRITRALGHVIAALALAALSAIVSCTSSSLSSTGPSVAKCQIAVTGTNTPIAAGGGTTMVSIAAQPECAWTASTDVAWITDLAPAAGQGNSAVQVRAASNTDPVTRRGMVHIAATEVQITQAAAPCVFQLSALTRDVAAIGGSTSVSVSTNAACGWTAASAVSWIRVTAGGSSTGNGTVTLAVDANSGPARSGAVTVAGQTVTINQSSGQTTPPAPVPAPTPAPPEPPGPPPPPPSPPPPPPPTCSYSIAPTSGSVGATGGAGAAITVTAAASCSWTAVSNESWITVLSGTSGSGNGTVTYSAAANTGAARSGSITIGGQKFTVTQAAFVCTYSISPSSQTITLTGGTGAVLVTAPESCTWTAVSDADWLTVTAGASGSGNGTVAFTAASIGGDKNRNGTITIATQTFTVTEKK